MWFSAPNCLASQLTWSQTDRKVVNGGNFLNFFILYFFFFDFFFVCLVYIYLGTKWLVFLKVAFTNKFHTSTTHTFQKVGFPRYSAEMMKTESNMAKPCHTVLFLLHCVAQHGWPLGYLCVKNKSFLYSNSWVWTIHSELTLLGAHHISVIMDLFLKRTLD